MSKKQSLFVGIVRLEHTFAPAVAITVEDTKPLRGHSKDKLRSPASAYYVGRRHKASSWA